jgi:hypothetical protein
MYLCELLASTFRNLCALFGKIFWNLIFGRNLGEQLWGTTLRLSSSIDEQVLKTDSFGE